MLRHPSKVILLMGGKSSRMGELKGLLDYFGEPWVLEQLRRFSKAGIKQVSLILGFCAQEYFDKLPFLLEASRDQIVFENLRISTRINLHPEQGPFSSLCLGISTSVPRGSPAFVLPIDIPSPDPSVWESLENALSAGIQVAIPTYQGRKGHPVLLSENFQQKLLNLGTPSPEARLDVQIRSLSACEKRLIEVPDSKVLLNLNHPDEWKNYLRTKNDRQQHTLSV